MHDSPERESTWAERLAGSLPLALLVAAGTGLAVLGMGAPRSLNPADPALVIHDMIVSESRAVWALAWIARIGFSLTLVWVTLTILILLVRHTRETYLETLPPDPPTPFSDPDAVDRFQDVSLFEPETSDCWDSDDSGDDVCDPLIETNARRPDHASDKTVRSPFLAE